MTLLASGTGYIEFLLTMQMETNSQLEQTILKVRLLGVWFEVILKPFNICSKINIKK